MSTPTQQATPVTVSIDEREGDLCINGTHSPLDAPGMDAQREQAVSRLRLLARLQRTAFTVTISGSGDTTMLDIDRQGVVTDTTPVEETPADTAIQETAPDDDTDDLLDAIADTAAPTGADAPAVRPEAATRRFGRRRVIVAFIAAGTLLLTAAGVLASRWYVSGRHDAAFTSCQRASKDLAASRNALRRSLTDSAAASRIDTGQVRDPATVTALRQARSQADLGGAPECATRMDTAQLTALAGKLTALAATADGRTSAIGVAVDAVVASRDAKALADAKTSLANAVKAAQGTLDSSHGKVADNATRVKLQQAIDAANKVLDDKGVKTAKRYQDAQSSLAGPVKGVNDSVAAKAAADKTAADKAAADAAAAQAQAPSSSGSSSSSPSKRRSQTSGSGSSSSGSSTRRGTSGSTGSGSSGSSGGTPSWSVPGAGSDEGNIGGSDPGL